MEKNRTIGQQLVLSRIQRLSIELNSHDEYIARQQAFFANWQRYNYGVTEDKMRHVINRRDTIKSELKAERTLYVDTIKAQTVDEYCRREHRFKWLLFCCVSCLVFWAFVVWVSFFK